ncbi:MAG: DUF4238 domain-containing protein [Candidatus Gracilibacteria bacterium]|nr:DUF4238 domain-containing protein [Candidatus Gracilibacteria bacterium]
MNKVSKKHHYLPRKYLKGFSDNNNLFYIYDKEKDIIFQQYPDSFFFKNNLNTFEINGAEKDFLENLYTNTENLFWPSYEKIINSTPKEYINGLDKLNLYLFLLFLFWRLPFNEKIVENFVDIAFKKGEKLDFFSIVGKNGETGVFENEIIGKIKGLKDFKKILKILLPFYPFHKIKDWSISPLNWKFLYTQDNTSWYITSDNPIITNKENYNNLDSLLEDILFPISGKILLVGTKVKDNAIFSGRTIIDYNVAMIHNANRFVACHNKDLLLAMIDVYKNDKFHNKEHIIIPELFNSIK